MEERPLGLINRKKQGDKEGSDYSEQWSSIMMAAWAVMEVEKSARLSVYFQKRGKGFGDGLDMYVYGKGL